MAEFERGLRLAVPDGVARPQPGHLRVSVAGTLLSIEVTERPERRLGQFRLPLLLARYRFLSGDVPATSVPIATAKATRVAVPRSRQAGVHQ